MLEEKRTHKNPERDARELTARCRRIEKYKLWLPFDILSLILIKLCDDIETDGVRGVSVVARDICNVCLAFSDLGVASRSAFEELAIRCHSLNDGRTIWDEFSTDPGKAEFDSMEKVTKGMWVSTSGTKRFLVSESTRRDERALRLAKEFATKPTKATSLIPAGILNAVQAEKSLQPYPSRLADMCAAVLPEVGHIGSLFRLRKTLINLGFTTLPALRARYEVIMEEERKTAKQARLAELRAKACVCGFNAAAAQCSFHRCAICCPGPCGRHVRKSKHRSSESKLHSI